MTLKKRDFENIVGKGENAGNQHFLLFPQCFLPYHIEIIISATFIVSSANTLNLDQSKILPFGKGLIFASQEVTVTACGRQDWLGKMEGLWLIAIRHRSN